MNERPDAPPPIRTSDAPGRDRIGPSRGASSGRSRSSSRPRRRAAWCCSPASSSRSRGSNSPWVESYDALFAHPHLGRDRRPPRGRGPPLLDQRGTDGDLLPGRRPRDQARAHDGRAAPPPRRPPPGGRRGRRDGRAGAPLPRDRGNRARQPRLGDPDGDGRRARARRARAGRGPSPEPVAPPPARARDRRRHRLGRRRGPLLRRIGLRHVARRRVRRLGARGAPPEDPCPGDGRVRGARGSALVRDVPRGAPSGARRRRGRAADARRNRSSVRTP